LGSLQPEDPTTPEAAAPVNNKALKHYDAGTSNVITCFKLKNYPSEVGFTNSVNSVAA